jgi:hemolysin activation/secretion protein
MTHGFPGIFRPFPIALCAALFFGASGVHADVGTEEFLRHQERQEQLRQRMTPDPDVRLPRSVQPDSSIDPGQPETPCFTVNAVTLEGEYAEQFRARLDRALADSGYAPGMCLGIRSINLIMTRMQNRIIADGYMTTRVVVETQNIAQEQQIRLRLIPGRIHAIRFAGVEERSDWQGNAARTQYFRNEFPMTEGELLNLRDIETALENFRRLQSVEADFEILPASNPGESDLVLKWKQRFPLRATLSADDSGSRWTGKNQGTLVVSVDNPLGLSDTFYAYYSHDLGHQRSFRDHATGNWMKSGTKGYGFHYSAPFGNYLAAYHFSHNEYAQAVAGYFTSYLYQGWSNQHDLSLQRTLHRDGKRKTTAGVGVWIRSSRNYIDDAELSIQRRRMAGWRLELEHTEHFASMTLSARLQYKRGTGAHRSLNAPEEDFDEGTSRMRLFTGDLALSWPFRILDQTCAYSTQILFQNNRTPLIPQDRFSIGNRYTVRGFDGEMTLMAERGSSWRNELAWHYAPRHQIYLLWDSAHVSGHSTKWLAGAYLEGYGIGLRGQFKTSAALYYNLFTARPAKHPDAFPTQHSVIGANLSLSF